MLLNITKESPHNFALRDRHQHLLLLTKQQTFAKRGKNETLMKYRQSLGK